MDWIFTERGAEATPFILQSVAFIDCQYTHREERTAVVFDWLSKKKGDAESEKKWRLRKVTKLKIKLNYIEKYPFLPLTDTSILCIKSQER